jgi:PT repeat
MYVVSAGRASCASSGVGSRESGVGSHFPSAERRPGDGRSSSQPTQEERAHTSTTHHHHIQGNNGVTPLPISIALEPLLLLLLLVLPTSSFLQKSVVLDTRPTDDPSNLHRSRPRRLRCVYVDVRDQKPGQIITQDGKPGRTITQDANTNKIRCSIWYHIFLVGVRSKTTSKMSGNNDETDENAKDMAVNREISHHSLKSPKKARHGGARLVVLVLGLIGVVVSGVGASFFMENKGLNLKTDTDLEEGMVSLLSAQQEVIPEPDSDEGPRILQARPTRRPTRKPTRMPTRKPTRRPTRKPTRRPTRKPTRRPTRRPTRKPTPRPASPPSRDDHDDGDDDDDHDDGDDDDDDDNDGDDDDDNDED